MTTVAQMKSWNDVGFFLVKGFAPQSVLDEMLDTAVELCKATGGDGLHGDIIVQPEQVHVGKGLPPEDSVAKIFRVHRQEEVFRKFCSSSATTELLAGILGPQIDCFLSQFIFKTPGALGQPWHQDSYYFPFNRTPQVGLWLAVTAATAENGPLWVLPHSQQEPVHSVIPDPRPVSQNAFVEIVDHDMSDAIQVLMEPGDLLVFHSHLMHKSTDNVADYIRAAMVYHLASAGTVNKRTRDGFSPPNNQDWLPVLRNGNRA